MLLRRFYDHGLAQASFLVGCQATGEAIVIDPNRDAQQYLDAAREEKVRIIMVTETHIHADFLSGSRELAALAEARLLLSKEGGADWQYAFAAAEGAKLIGEGSRFTVGNLAFEVWHTPGHTPEHLIFFVTDTPATDRPVGAFTGDFVFAGDVGRPDLLERAAHIAGTMETSARALFRSLQRFRALPDYLQLWPGHGAGSACGKALGAMPQTTVGYERLANWAFAIDEEERFVSEVLAGQPEPPRYFAEMKRLNREGPSTLGGFREPPAVGAARFASLVDERALIIDTRRAELFAAGHIPGTISVPLNRSFSTYAGSIIPFDRDFYLIVDDGVPGAAARAARDLAMIGLDRAAGAIASGALATWVAAGHELATLSQLGVKEAAARASRGEIALLDVRNRSEWNAGHPTGVPNIPLSELPERHAEVAKGKPVAVLCQSGARSVVASSLLLAQGGREVINVTGGFAEWARNGLPVEPGA
jgi:hydroxyacylglutathione hydrolase